MSTVINLTTGVRQSRVGEGPAAAERRPAQGKASLQRETACGRKLGRETAGHMLALVSGWGGKGASSGMEGRVLCRVVIMCN